MSLIDLYRITIRPDYSSATLQPLDTTISNEIVTIHGLSQLRSFYTNDIVLYEPSSSTLTLKTPSPYRKEKIPGILLIDSTYKYGSNSRGVPRYQCRPSFIRGGHEKYLLFEANVSILLILIIV